MYLFLQCGSVYFDMSQCLHVLPPLRGLFRNVGPVLVILRSYVYSFAHSCIYLPILASYGVAVEIISGNVGWMFTFP